MARGKRKTALQTIEEQIVKIDRQIGNYQDKIGALQSKKKDLLELEKQQELEILRDKIQASGKTVDEVLKAIDAQ